jgi:SAM-dependent methyltransferase
MWFRQLPYGPIAKGNFEWRYRQAGWEIINQRLKGQPRQKILDIGAWNGWLSHRLVAAEHQVVAVDYFVDPLDGLGAMTHYDVAWPAIQMDLENLTNLPVAFDLIIVNHCLQFFATPLETLRQAQQLLIQDGKILVIGLAFFADPRKQIERVKRYRTEFGKHGVDFFKPMKGYLDFYDRKHLQQEGIKFHPYQQLWKANLRSQIDPTRPRYEFGLYAKDK